VPRPSNHPTHRVEAVTSAANPLLKSIRRAVSRGDLTAEGHCVAEGFHLLEEAILRGSSVAAVLFTAAAAPAVEARSSRLPGARMLSVPEPVFASISSTETTQGVIALIEPAVWTLDAVIAAGSVIVLDGIQDPGNAGAIVRSAEAFGAGGAVFLKGTVSPFNTKCLRASAGSLLRFPHAHGVANRDLLGCLKRNGIPMFVAMPVDGVPINAAPLAGRCAIAFGSEGHGVSREVAVASSAIRIPTSRVESLNASVAAGVILYEAWRQRTGA
jgi:RNA methyltransferase, TrmH family